MMKMRLPSLFLLLSLAAFSHGFSPSILIKLSSSSQQQQIRRATIVASSTSPATAANEESTAAETTDEQTAVSSSFIQTELRGAAMKLHTTMQAPKEGQVVVEKQSREPYTPTLDDYLQYLVDSQHVYATMEEIVNTNESLKVFRNTGLERVEPLERSIEYILENIPHANGRPEVGEMGRAYGEHLRHTISNDGPAAFTCHFYNHYFAHTAGGRMIGKKMSSLLLDKHTLDFYKWEGNLNKIKEDVKESIECMAREWTPEERKACVDATPSAFQYGGALNSYLSTPPDKRTS